MKEVPRFFFTAVYISLFLGIAYNTITSMAGVYIASELGGSQETAVYPMVFFGLGCALGIPPAHALGDRIGPMRVMGWCLIFYSIFSILCTIVPTYFLFNLLRVAMGIPCGIIYVLCRRLIFTYAAPEKVPLFGLLLIFSFAIAPVIGSCIGSWLSYYTGWQWIFWLNLPFS